MRKLLYILFVASSILLTACHRHTIPAVNNSDSTFIKQKDSIIIKDTTIIFKDRNAESIINADSLLKIIDSLKKAGIDTSSFFPYLHIVDSSLSGDVSISGTGKIKFTCKEDSLKAVIRNLTTSYLKLYVKKQQIKTIDVPVTVTKYKERSWLWWWFGITALLIGLKITAMFVPSNSTNFLSTILKLFK